MTFPFDESEYQRWLEQAEATSKDADLFAAQGLHHWASFAAEQAAEAALKGLLRGFGKPVVTHSMKQLFDAPAQLGIEVDEVQRHASRVLERHYNGSDIDVLLVSERFEADFMRRQGELYALSPGGLDLFAYTPEELREMIGKNHPTAYWARREGVVVRNPAVWDALWGPEPPES